MAELEVTLKHMAELMGLKSISSLSAKARRNNWLFREEGGSGRLERHYNYSSLPIDTQKEIAQKASEMWVIKLSMADGLSDEVSGILESRIVEMIQHRDQVTAQQKAAKKTAKQAPKKTVRLVGVDTTPLVKAPASLAWQEKMEAAGVTLPCPASLVVAKRADPEKRIPDEARRDGAMNKQTWINWYDTQKRNRFKSREIELMLGQFKEAGEAVPALRTIQWWSQKTDEKGAVGLLDGRISSGRKPIITHELSELIMMLYVYCPDARPKRLAEVVQIEAGVAISERTMLNWLNKQKNSLSKRLFAFLANPDKAKRFLPFPGDAEGWRRMGFLDRVEWDGSPADVHCTDGRFSLMAGIDVATRQVQVILAPSSGTYATKLLLRQILLAWGKPKSFRGDQGSEFINSDMEWIFNSLDIFNSPAMPYSGDQKPFVERFFGTLTRGLFEVLPGYSGHNVADAQNIRSRHRFDQRRQIEKQDEEAQDKAYYRVKLDHTELYELIQKALAVYHEEEHSGLKKTPNQRLEELLPQAVIVKPDVRELDILLNEQQTRQVTAKGIRYKTLGETRVYSCADYDPYIGHQVRVFFDQNPHQIHAFSMEGEYLFTAYDRAINSEQAIAMREAALEQVSTQIDYYQALIKRAGYEENDPFIESLDQRAVVGLERHDQVIGKIHQQSSIEQQSQLQLAVVAGEEFDKQEADSTQEEVVVEDLGPIAAAPAEVQGPDRFLVLYKELEAQIQRGEQLDNDDLDWMERLEKTPAVKDYKQSCLGVK